MVETKAIVVNRRQKRREAFKTLVLNVYKSEEGLIVEEEE